MAIKTFNSREHSVNLSEFFIRRPAFTIVVSLVLIIVGLIGFMNLPLKWIPNISAPQVNISTTYPGANARLVEHDITMLIEESLSGINGIETLTSASRQGESSVNLMFKLGKNMDAAVEDVRSAIERIRGSLPKDALSPVVSKADPTSMPILFVTIYDRHYSERELSDYIEKFIVPTFETIDGVGSVVTYGKRISALKVALDPVKMAAAKLTADEVTQLLQEQNASIPSGQIRSFDRYYGVITNTSLKTVEQFNELIIRNDNNQAIRLKDIGEAKLDAKDAFSSFRVSGRPAIALGIIPQSTANPLEIESNIQKVLVDFKRTLPQGMEMSIEYNQADYIRASIHSVYESFFEAVFFVWIVILAFLCNFRATIIPVITIPVCIISTFALLYFLNFSINTITLMALVLAIGLVVDDAIVMLENISRHMEMGLSPFAAATKGSREIMLPIIAMTLTLAAVYAPIAFTPGVLGILFREFTFTLAGAVIISGIVALTLSPMMCARVLKPIEQANSFQSWLTQQFSRLQDQYQFILSFLLSKRKLVLGILVVIAGLGLGSYQFLSSEFSPAEDMSEIDVFIAGPRSASFQYTDHYVRELENLYQSYPDILSYFSQSGTYSASHAYQILKIKPKKERHLSIDQMVEQLTQEANKIPGVRVNIFKPSPPLSEMAGGDSGDRIGLVLMTTSDYTQLQLTTQRIMDIMKDVPGIVHVDNSLKWDNEQFQIDIDRSKAADLKVTMPTIANTLSTLLAGKTVGKMDDADIIVQLSNEALTDPNIFQSLYVRNIDGVMIPISQLMTINEKTMPELYRRYGRLRADTIYMTLAPTFKLADAIKKVEKIVKENLPQDMKYTFSGEAKSFLESQGKTIFTFFLALVFIYLVLVAQFESFISPLIILFTVPFAIVGAILTLKLFGGTLNIYSNIGLITLIGLIAKHGILITEFANRLRREGKSIKEAVMQAAALRLRPILMTTSAMVLGALPLAFAFGPGAESRQQVGLIITGGLLVGTFFSLVVVPITYTYLAPWQKLKTNLELAEDATIL